MGSTAIALLTAGGRGSTAWHGAEIGLIVTIGKRVSRLSLEKRKRHGSAVAESD
jgi:hypothetical protein